jgi:hypothetical protein
MIQLRQFFCKLFGQCADADVKPLAARIARLEEEVYKERRVAWDDVMVPKRNNGHGR